MQSPLAPPDVTHWGKGAVVDDVLSRTKQDCASRKQCGTETNGNTIDWKPEIPILTDTFVPFEAQYESHHLSVSAPRCWQHACFGAHSRQDPSLRWVQYALRPRHFVSVVEVVLVKLVRVVVVSVVAVEVVVVGTWMLAIVLGRFNVVKILGPETWWIASLYA